MLFMLQYGLITWFVYLIILSGDVEINPGPNGLNGLLLNTRSIKSVNSKYNKIAELQSLISVIFKRA